MTQDQQRRTVLGTAVHLIAFFTSIVGAGAVYLLSSSEFTSENARNALNWHILYTVVGLAVSIPAVLIGGSAVIVGAGIVVIGGFATILFTAIATLKAIGGTSWPYPIAPRFV